MKTDVVIRKNQYFDSVFLMSVARRLSEQAGIKDAAAVMGTANNKKLLIDMGFAESSLTDAGPNDLIVAIRGARVAVETILSDVDRWLVRTHDRLSGAMVSTSDAARARQPDSNLVVISVPGEYAAREAHAALEHGMNVFLFSDHVSMEDELNLKRRAAQAGLIVMGPDCGTAIISGVGIGFANVVRRGPVGVIGSTGTGLQEFASLVHRGGGGISHAIGTGSRDLSDVVGGISTLTALEELEVDDQTQIIVILAKPPGSRALTSLIGSLNRCAKPIVACFLGLAQDQLPDPTHFRIVHTLDEAASVALEMTVGSLAASMSIPADAVEALVAQESDQMAPQQKYVRGLFAGGTFCYQAQQIMREGGLTVYSNAPLAGMQLLPDATRSLRHTLVDMGDEEFTRGKPHPMIDATQRRKRILVEAKDNKIAILLLDFILGYNASPDPAGDLAETIVEAKRKLAASGGYLSVVASICGTDLDPQDVHAQEAILQEAGAVVFASNAQASRLAREIVLRLAGRI